MLRTSPTRVLDDRDLPRARALLAQDPVGNVFVASRIAAAGLDSWRLGAEVWGYSQGSELVSMCFAGANLAPVSATPAAIDAFAERARKAGRRCSSLVGPAADVLALWSRLAEHWGPARDVREDQPLLVLRRAPLVTADPQVRRVATGEIERLLPAAIAMFTEEVGVSPLGSDGGSLYRARVTDLVGSGRAFARFDGDRVIFKAEVGAATPDACQVQGVWVQPELRGHGLGTAGTAAVATIALAEIAPAVSLYVNSFNVGARVAYERVGFVQEGTFASILF